MSTANRSVHIGLWVLQVLLGLMMVMSGANKLFNSEAELVKMGMTFINDYGIGFARFLGVCLLAGGVGLVAPPATKILPWLTPFSGAMLAIYFALATALHLSRGESPVLTIVIMLLSAVVAWGRFKKAPIAARG
jgi:hypothetical protein